MKKTILALGLAASFAVSAGGYEPAPAPTPEKMMNKASWYFGVGMGYTKDNDMYLGDGQTTLARLSVGVNISQYQGFKLGFETGMQTGSQSRLNLTEAQSFDLGDVAVQTFINPMADVLVSLSGAFNKSSSLFLKGGVAFRQMHFDRDTMNSFSKVSPELQAGVSVKVSNKASLSLAYQGVFGGNLNLVTSNPLNTSGSGTGVAENIPSQHGGLLTLTMNV